MPRIRFRALGIPLVALAAASCAPVPGPAADAPAPRVYPGDARAGGTAARPDTVRDAGWRPAPDWRAGLQLPGASLEAIVARLPSPASSVRVRSSSWPQALEAATVGQSVVLRGAPVAAVRLATDLRCPGGSGGEPVAALVRITPRTGGLWIEASFDAPAGARCELSAAGRSRLLGLATDAWMWAHGLAAPRAQALQ